MMRAAKTAALILLVSIFAFGSSQAASGRPWATIGTGSAIGVYYNVGQALKKTLDRYPSEPAIKLSVEETRGSIENIEAVTSGRFYFGIAQSDTQFRAWNGANGTPWAGRPQKNLRAVISLYTEAISMVVATSSGILSLSDLKSRRVRINLGQPGSGHYISTHEILSAIGINPSMDLTWAQVSPTSALDMFARNQIDAFFYTAGHPAAQFHEVARGKRQAQFVALQPEDEMLANFPYYKRTTIPMKYYPGMANPCDVPTIGVNATVVASADTPEWMVYGLVKAIDERYDYLNSQLKIFESLTYENALEALTAPIHTGALKYYREIGLKP